MKKSLLLLSGMVLFCLSDITAQSLGSDDPVYFNGGGNPSPSNMQNSPQRAAIVTNTVTACDSGSVILGVSGVCDYSWYADTLATVLLSNNAPYTTSVLTADTTLFLQSFSPNHDSVEAVVLPAQTGTFSGNTRGMWFQSPSDFTITGLHIPGMTSGNTDIAVVKFTTGPPPVYGATTNAFTVLGLWQNEAEDTIQTCIQVMAGDYIGMLGSRGGVNSYAAAPVNTSVNGVPIVLERLGMQYALSTTAPQDLWTESGSSISRVEFFYTDDFDSTIVPIQVTVPKAVTATPTINVCSGDSIYLAGAYQTTPGPHTYVLSNFASNGCDSIISATLSFLPVSSSSQTVALCSGDSILIDGNYVSTSGIYTEVLQAANSCDSTVTYTINATNIDISTSTVGITLTSATSGASYQWLDCDNGNSPISGETNQSFTPIVNGNYSVAVTLNGCSDTSTCVSIASVGLTEFDLDKAFVFYPNPISEIGNYTYFGTEKLSFTLTDVSGKIVWEGTSESQKGKIDLNDFANGTYLLKVETNAASSLIRIVKK
jgi:hypothetical protein